MARQKPGEIVLLNFPFTDPLQSKKRPAIVLCDDGDEDLLLARVTTRAPASQHDVPIMHWQQAGLLKPSVVRLHKLATLKKQFVEKGLGRVDPKDWAQVMERWAALLK